MHRIIFVYIVGLLSWSNVVAQPIQTPSIEVHVAGMVCAFCIQGIEKTLLALENVQSIDINLKTKVVTVRPKRMDAVTDDHIRKAIDDAGYEVTKIVRSLSALPSSEVTVPGAQQIQKVQKQLQRDAATPK